MGAGLVNPGIGLIFWMSLAFLVVLFLLRKFAWSGILNTLREREEFIEKSLKSAEEAKAQMSQLKSDNEKLLAEARQERRADFKRSSGNEGYHFSRTQRNKLLKNRTE